MRCRPPKFGVVPVLSLLSLLSALNSVAQTDSFSLASGTTSASGTVSLSLTLTSPAGSEPAAIQWAFGFPSANVTSISATAGNSLTNASKTLSCASRTGTYTCVAYGLKLHEDYQWRCCHTEPDDCGGRDFHYDRNQ